MDVDVAPHGGLRARPDGRVGAVEDQRHPHALVAQVSVPVHRPPLPQVEGVVCGHQEHGAGEPRLVPDRLVELPHHVVRVVHGVVQGPDRRLAGRHVQGRFRGPEGVVVRDGEHHGEQGPRGVATALEPARRVPEDQPVLLPVPGIELTKSQVESFLMRDKKSTMGTVQVVLLSSIGCYEFVPLEDPVELVEALKRSSE